MIAGLRGVVVVGTGHVDFEGHRRRRRREETGDLLTVAVGEAHSSENILSSELRAPQELGGQGTTHTTITAGERELIALARVPQVDLGQGAEGQNFDVRDESQRESLRSGVADEREEERVVRGRHGVLF